MAGYDSRIATRITRDADRRLRLTAMLLRKPLNHVLTDLIGQALPPADELAERLKDDTVEAGAA